MILAPQSDVFAPTDQKEQQVREELDQRINTLRLELDAVTALVGIEFHLGFRQFLKAVDDASQRCEQKLRTMAGSDSELRVIQGRAQAFKEVLGLCRGGIPLQQRLATLLAEAQDQRKRNVLPNGKVIPPRSV